MNESLLHQMRSSSPRFGTWLSLGSPIVSELAAHCGLHWILIDLEHGSMDYSGVLPMLQAASGSPMATIVRVPSHEPSLIARILDWGATGIMVPHVSHREQALSLVQATRYPPQGIRGHSRTVRAYAYGLRPPSDQSPPLLFAQIEDAEAVENIDEIASVDGIDTLFVGPSDLQLSLSATSSKTTYEEALERIVASAQRHHRQAGILNRDPENTANLLQKGFTKIAINSDLSMLRTAFLKIVKEC